MDRELIGLKFEILLLKLVCFFGFRICDLLVRD